MSRPPVNCLRPGDLDWKRVDVYGAAMDKAVVFEGAHDVRSAFFRMAAGCTIESHTHTKWVQVMVLDGCMRVQQENAEPFRAPGGSVYFVNPGFAHVETAEVDTLLLVTQGEDRPGWRQAGPEGFTAMAAQDPAPDGPRPTR